MRAAVEESARPVGGCGDDYRVAKLTGSILPAAYLDELLDVGDLLRHCDGGQGSNVCVW